MSDHEPQTIQPATRSIARVVLPDPTRKETTSTLKRERVRTWDLTGHMPAIRLPQHLAIELLGSVAVWVDSPSPRAGEGRQMRDDRRIEFPADSLIEEGMVTQAATNALEPQQSVCGDGLALYVLRVDRTENGALRAVWAPRLELEAALRHDVITAAEQYLIAEVWSTWEVDGEHAAAHPVFIDLISMPVFFNPDIGDDLTRPVRSAGARKMAGDRAAAHGIWVALDAAIRRGELGLSSSPDAPMQPFGPMVRLPGGALHAQMTYSPEGELVDPVRAGAAAADARLNDLRNFKQMLTRLREEIAWVDPLTRKERMYGLVDQIDKLVDEQAARSGSLSFSR